MSKPIVRCEFCLCMRNFVRVGCASVWWYVKVRRTLCGDCMCWMSKCVGEYEFCLCLRNLLRSDVPTCGEMQNLLSVNNPLRKLCVSEVTIVWQNGTCDWLVFVRKQPLVRLCASKVQTCGDILLLIVPDQPSAEMQGLAIKLIHLKTMHVAINQQKQTHVIMSSAPTLPWASIPNGHDCCAKMHLLDFVFQKSQAA